MPELQTSLEATAFGDELQTRLDRAEAVLERARQCYCRLHQETGAAWQLMIIDEAATQAARAYRHAQDGDRYEDHIAAGEHGIVSAEHAVDQIVAGVVSADE